MSGAINKNFKKRKILNMGWLIQELNYDNFENFDFIIAIWFREKFFKLYWITTMIYPTFPTISCKKKIEIKR